MNLVDLLLILVFLLALWTGWQKGFILGTVNLIVWVGSLLVGFLAYRPLGNLLLDIFPGLGVWTQPLSFFVAIALARLVLALICNPLLNRTSVNAHERPVNHALGLIPGAVNGFVYAVILAALLLSTPISNTITDATKKSTITGRLSHEVAWLDDKLSPIFYPALQKTMAGLTVEPGADETVILHFKVKDASVRPDLEAEMLQLVNQERTKRGIAPLKADTALTAVARDHSRDMFEEGYFSHYTLSGKDPFERMHDHGVHFTTAGENLALGQTLSICHDGLMNSPGHRANILNPAFGRVGIGILDGGFHGLMISQEFRN